MNKITILSGGKVRQVIAAGPGVNLLTTLQAAGLYVPALCGGRNHCGKCAVKIDGDWQLACACFPAADISVEVPETEGDTFSAINTFTLNVNSDTLNSAYLSGGAEKPEYGIAVDIGTTTLGFVLVCLNNGNIAARHTGLNRQRMYGGDVISRIQRANDGGLELLQRCICEQIVASINTLCSGVGVAATEVKQIAIAGNTVMLHLLLGLSCRGLGIAPFTPVTLDLLVRNSRELFGELCPAGLDCDTTILPGITAYVGADITAGIFFTNLNRGKETSILLDIGTNGEMALAHNGKIYCTATAAGPAFEGGNMLWGTGSIPGAIAQVQYHDDCFQLTTIGDKPPLGICGSGVMDLVYQGLRHGLIGASGRFSEEIPDAGIFLAKSPDGRDIVFCQKDVRELQLAKSAIRTGMDFLLGQASGRTYHDIDHLYIAGGFGFNLNLESAAGIGLIPQALLPKVELVGNSALGGAARYLLKNAPDELCAIAKQADEVHLPGNALFNDRFTENLALVSN